MDIKDKLKKKQVALGTWITLCDPIIPELLAPAKFDWMCVDLEHTSITLNELKPIIISIENIKSTPLVRVGENNYNLIKRVMDIGASGVIVPNINTVEDAKKAIDAVKYPPKGKRGMGLYRAQSFGNKLNEYIKWNDNKSLVIIQIESQEALDNIDNILGLKNLDAFFVGPYDLTASMGIPGEFHHEKYKKALKKILNSANKNNITPGIHSVSPDYKIVKNYIRKGFKMIGYSLDTIFLAENASRGMKNIR